MLDTADIVRDSDFPPADVRTSMICFVERPTVKLSPTSAFLSVVFVSFLSMRLLAQQSPGVQAIDGIRENQRVTTYESAPNTAVIIVHTFAEEKPVSLDRSARVDLTNLGNHRGVFLTVSGRENAVFTNTALGRYTISVTAVGYMSATQAINVLSPEKQDVEVVLHRDPAAVTLNEASGLLSGKARKEASRAVSLLKSGDLTNAEKHLKTAYVSAPSNADLNFLLGYLYFQKNDHAQAGTYLGTAASLSPHSAQTLTLLGRAKLAVQNYPEAESALEQAILVDSEEWLAHDLLADTYLHQREFSKALDEARVAVAKSARHGKVASAAAELTLGQALIGVGQKNEGIQALRVYLDASPPKNMIEPVHALITKAQESNQQPAAGSEITTSPDPLTAVPKPVLSMQTWRPPDIDDTKPTLEPGVTCPCAQVLAKAGQRVQELVQDITRFTAEENLFHKSLDGVGLSNHAETRRYNYAAAISSKPGSVLIEDYSEDRVPQSGSPDGIASTGFVMLALVFHPEMQSDFDFDCEGQGKWIGKPTWLVHFRQRPDRPNRMQDYNLSGKIYRIDLKGRAWISSDTSQIVHIEADMVNPMHEIQMLSEHQVVEYGPVPFARKSTMLWLPKNVEIYFDFGKHHYYRHYTFDNYMLFDVDASEKVKLPPDTVLSGPTSPTQKIPD
ncbi:MAG TPA: tetratricopeptide repeat protein [Terriglobales bacterium]|nr:tetratricopeptide repeat protein [Terriglobales bacterium]